MPGFTSAYSATTLDTLFPTSAATDYIGYAISITGGGETAGDQWANLARTAIGATGWSAATVADPSVKANANVLTSGTVASAGGTVAYFAIFSASTAGTMKTTWTALDTPRALSVGDSLQWAVGACKITLT